MDKQTVNQELWFVFRAGNVLVRAQDNEGALVRQTDIAPLRDRLQHVMPLGTHEAKRYLCGELSADVADVPGTFINPRDLLPLLGEELFQVCGRGLQLLHWEKTNAFCGRCGARMGNHATERAKICPSCGLTVFPRLSPAVIVAVVRDGKLLLARNRNFRRPFYSVLAGFVEPGETFEQCVQREVHEEAGITVKNIRYVGSQPWPFPDSLMVGFTAEYDSGELTVDGEELHEAGWFAPDNLPPIPPPGSISRRLIDLFLNGHLS